MLTKNCQAYPIYVHKECDSSLLFSSEYLFESLPNQHSEQTQKRPQRRALVSFDFHTNGQGNFAHDVEGDNEKRLTVGDGQPPFVEAVSEDLGKSR